MPAFERCGIEEVNVGALLVRGRRSARRCWAASVVPGAGSRIE